MTATGEVIKVINNTAIVKIRQKSACGHECTNCGACGETFIEAEALNPLNAKCGDRVVIENNSSNILKIAFMLYMLPVFIIISAGIFAKVTNIKGVYTALIFITLFALWFIVLRFYNNKKVEKNIIIRIL